MQPGRGQRKAVLLQTIWDNRGGTTSAQKLYDAALRTPEGKELEIKLADVKLFLEDESRYQVFRKPRHEWPGKQHLGGEADQIMSVDTIELYNKRNVQGGRNDGYNYIFCAQTRWDRMLYARPLRSLAADAGEVVAAMESILNEIGPDVKETVSDNGGEYTNALYKDFLRRKGIVDRKKGGDGDARATLQNMGQFGFSYGSVLENAL